MARGSVGAAPILCIHGLRFRHPGAASDTLCIDDWQVPPCAHLLIHGPSGSGKSTLLSLLGGVLVASQGRVQLMDHDLAALSSRRRDALRVDHCGFVFQQFNLLPYLTVQENVLLPCRFSRRRDARARAQDGSPTASALRLLSVMGLGEEVTSRRVATLSVGQQQRVAAARALIGAPELVMADEPTSALDDAAQADLVDLLFAECERAGSTLLVVSHDRRLMSRFALQQDVRAFAA